MSTNSETANPLCLGCVYFPPNLPVHAYPIKDWNVLQGKQCSYDLSPDGIECQQTRKINCSIVDLRVPTTA